MSIRKLLLSLFAIITLAPLVNAQSNPSRFVNPFIGTGGHGHTFPGATVPFGMVQLSPDTRLEGWDGCSGYHYSDKYIYGFSHTHLSGTGCSDYGDLLLMPFSGKTVWNNGYNGKSGYRSKFSHKNETASAGYYSVKLADDNIAVQLTATARAGMHSYLFPKGDLQQVMIDLKHRDEVTNSWINVVSNNEVEGFRGSTNWANDQRVYFVIRFSRDIRQITMALDDKVTDQKVRLEGKNVKAALNFGNANSGPLIIKVGLSAVSTQNARENLEAEIPGWDFQEVRSEATALWNRALSKIEAVSDNTDDLTVFYTALYHTMVSPNIYNDVNGSYLGRDLKPHKADFNYYTVFSLWDTYRALHPLFTIIDQKRTNDFINTFIKQYEQGGLLPVWELSSNETYCMIGYHSIPVIADAYLKGIKGYDAEKALKAMLASAMNDRGGMRFYKKYGFIPSESEPESVSKTLEYAYDDWCIAKMAEAMDKQGIADTFMLRAQGYKHLFDPATGFMRARYNGTWFMPFDPREVNFNYTEANCWQYSFYVPQDMDHFTQLLGGKLGLDKKLDGLFTAETATTGREQSDITGLIGQYAHGNEPSHHIAYLYDYAGKPWKTQEKVNFIMHNFYTNKPDGLIGNEDCGQMSAWAVLSSMGFYAVCPGSNQYAIGKPEFNQITINLENGNKFMVKARNLSNENIYIQSANLNGKPYHKSYITHEDIMKGGVLSFEMGKQANTTWGTGDGNEPSTTINTNIVQVAPIIEDYNQMFDEPVAVKIKATDNATVRYTLDGTEPTEQSTLFTKPFMIDKSTIVKFRAYHKGLIPSAAQQAIYTKRPQNISLKLNTKYEPQYSGSGVNTLIDGLKGNEDFRLGGWQGYQGVDVEALVQLSNREPVKSVTIGFFQDINAWIFMPEKIELWSSSDGINYKLLSTITNDVPKDQWGVVIKNYTFTIPSIDDRYFKIKGVNMGVCPSWHKGNGNKAWLFVDEITFGY